MIERALSQTAPSPRAGSPPLSATIAISVPCGSCRLEKRGGCFQTGSSRTANSTWWTSRTTGVDDTTGTDQAALTPIWWLVAGGDLIEDRDFGAEDPDGERGRSDAAATRDRTPARP